MNIEKWKRQVVYGLFAVATIALPVHKAAAAYPEMPIRLVVPYAAGGGIDAIARLVAQRMGPLLGQPVVVENKAGASGMIGTEFVIKAKPDGYVLLMAGNTELTTSPLFVSSVKYDVSRDLVPIRQVAAVPNILAATSSKKGTLREIVESASPQHPVSIGTAGNGTTHHLAIEALKAVTKANLTHVPYKGAAPAVSDALGGQIDMVASGLPPLLPHFAKGKLRPLAITAEKRSALVPDIPTVGEALGPAASGVIANTWAGVLAPMGTPPDAVAAIQKTLNTVLQEPDTRARLAKLGAEVTQSQGKDFARLISDESKFYRGIAERYKVLGK